MILTDSEQQQWPRGSVLDIAYFSHNIVPFLSVLIIATLTQSDIQVKCARHYIVPMPRLSWRVGVI